MAPMSWHTSELGIDYSPVELIVWISPNMILPIVPSSYTTKTSQFSISWWHMMILRASLLLLIGKALEYFPFGAASGPIPYCRIIVFVMSSTYRACATVAEEHT